MRLSHPLFFPKSVCLVALSRMARCRLESRMVMVVVLQLVQRSGKAECDDASLSGIRLKKDDQILSL